MYAKTCKIRFKVNVSYETNLQLHVYDAYNWKKKHEKVINILTLIIGTVLYRSRAIARCPDFHFHRLRLEACEFVSLRRVVCVVFRNA